MNRKWQTLNAAIAYSLMFSLSSAAVPSVVLAQTKPAAGATTETTQEKPAKHHSRTAAYILTLAGAGTMGAGAYLIAYQPTYDDFYYVPGTSEGIPGVHPIDFGHDSRAITGGIVLAVGALATVGGLLMMRKPKKTSEIEDFSTTVRTQFLACERINTRHDTDLADLPGMRRALSIGTLGRAPSNDNLSMTQASGSNPRRFQLNTTTPTPMYTAQAPCFAAPAFTVFARCSQ